MWGVGTLKWTQHNTCTNEFSSVSEHPLTKASPACDPGLELPVEMSISVHA